MNGKLFKPEPQDYRKILESRAAEEAERYDAFRPSAVSLVDLRNKENIARWRRKLDRIALNEPPKILAPKISVLSEIRRDFRELGLKVVLRRLACSVLPARQQRQ